MKELILWLVLYEPSFYHAAEDGLFTHFSFFFFSSFLNNNKAWCIFNELWGFQGLFPPSYYMVYIHSAYILTDTKQKIEIIIDLSKNEYPMQIKIVDMYFSIQG